MSDEDSLIVSIVSIRYLFLYVLVLKSFLVYVFDIFTAITMLTSDTWSNHIFNSCQKEDDNGCVFVPFEVGKWLFVGCIIFSFLLVRVLFHRRVGLSDLL